MLCKKCKTAVSETDALCSYCGAKVRRGGHVKLGLLLFLPLAFILVNLYFIQVNDVSLVEEDFVPIPTAQAPEEGAADEILDIEEINDPSDVEEPEDITEPEPETFKIDPYTLTADAAKAAYELYERFEVYSAYVSNKGYLYEYSTQTFITMRDLMELTDIDANYKDEDVLILYLKPSDLAQFSQLNITSNNLMEIYTAYETMEGFIIYSVDEFIGILPREDMQELLYSYEYEHGDVVQVEKNSSEHEDISYAIGALYSGRNSFDYRYLFRDDKYAVAVVSPKSDSTKLKMYVLEYANDMWFVTLQGIEEDSKHRQYINERIADLNLEIVPNYNLSSFLPYMHSDYSDVVRSMKLNMEITDEDEPLVYSSGINDFCCLEFASGRKFVGSLEADGLWHVEEINSYTDGVNFLNSKSNRPPLFILKQYD